MNLNSKYFTVMCSKHNTFVRIVDRHNLITVRRVWSSWCSHSVFGHCGLSTWSSRSDRLLTSTSSLYSPFDGRCWSNSFDRCLLILWMLWMVSKYAWEDVEDLPKIWWAHDTRSSPSYFTNSRLKPWRTQWNLAHIFFSFLSFSLERI